MSHAGIFTAPVSDVLASATSVLVAGAGGGFDVCAGLPLYFTLLRLRKEVTLANLSFTHLPGTSAEQIGEALFRVTADTIGQRQYSPEKYLAEWLSAHHYAGEIYCFPKTGGRPLRDAYAALAAERRIDAVVLVDGGTDIVMRGDEAGLGTPAEDMVSLSAASALAVPIKIVSCLGFGIDAYHGVCHAHFLENVAALSAAGGYLGTHSLHLDMPEVALFRDAVEHVHARMPDRPSIVNSSILSALEGQFGNVHRTDRTSASRLFINPLMSMYWHFDLAAVAARSLYLPRLAETETLLDVQVEIDEFVRSVTPRERQPIPV